MAEKINQKLLQILRETRKLSLQDIRLLESNCKLGVLKEKELPLRASQSIDLSFTPDYPNKTLAAVAHFTLTLAYNGADEGEPPVQFGARFGLRYAIREPRSRTHFEEAGRRVVALNVWPYWREFVQSMTARMGLPAFALPLMNPLHLRRVKGESGEKDPAN